MAQSRMMRSRPRCEYVTSYQTPKDLVDKMG